VLDAIGKGSADRCCAGSGASGLAGGRRTARGTGENDAAAPDHRRRLKDAQNTAAMLTTYNEVDMTR
jgi:hypothetical protein